MFALLEVNDKFLIAKEEFILMKCIDKCIFQRADGICESARICGINSKIRLIKFQVK